MSNPQDINPFDELSPYEKVSYLSSGSFGSVVLARHKENGKQMAVKSVLRGHTVDKNVQREVLNHQLLEHPHIVRYHEVFLSRTHLCIVIEYVPGGDMFDFIERRQGGRALTEDQARWFFQQLVLAVDYCHKLGVVNRDIKLENTLVDDANDPPTLKLCDFGYSKNLNTQSAPDSRVGTPAYLAPEVIQNPTGDRYDATASDVWSCGVMLYVLLTQCFPFSRTMDRHDDRMRAMIDRICRPDRDGGPDYIPPKSVSEPCIDLLKGILVRDPKRRLTLDQIMEHPWFLKNLPNGAIQWNRRLAETHLNEPGMTHEKRMDLEEMLRNAQTLDSNKQVMGGPVVTTGGPDAGTPQTYSQQMGNDQEGGPGMASPFQSTDLHGTQ